MAIKYGKTWWGEQWLGALKHIDYSNRLPRGASYARQGLVKEINIVVNRFQNELTDRIFILSLKAAGTGLNLTAATHVIHYAFGGIRLLKSRLPTVLIASGRPLTCRCIALSQKALLTSASTI